MARKLNLALGLGIAGGLCLAALMGCGSDSDDPTLSGGTGGATGGTGGTGGATGGTGGATGGTGGATGGTGGATGGTGGATGGTGGATGGTGGSGPDNDNDCANATDISQSGEATGVIDPTNEADHYKLTLPGGQFVILAADVVLPSGTSPDDLDYKAVLDTTITVYDEAGTTQLATMDDSYPRVDMNSQLVWHVPADGTYCIKVQDYGPWANETRDTTGENFEYTFGAYTLTAGADGNNVDTEDNDDAATAQAMTFAGVGDPPTNYMAWTFGLANDGNDVDVYAFTLPENTVSFSVEDLSTPIGPGGAKQSGNGSTLSLGLVNVTDTAGNIIAQLDAANGSNGINVPLQAGSNYLLWVNRANTTAGANNFYNFLQMAYATDNQGELNNNNNAADNAEEPASSEVESGVIGYFITGTIDNNDTDFWGFPVAGGDEISLACGAARSGSGLQGATFEVQSNTLQMLQSETETETADIWWTDNPNASSRSKPAVQVTASGTYFLKVTATAQKPNVSSNFYRCGVYVATP